MKWIYEKYNRQRKWEGGGEKNMGNKSKCMRTHDENNKKEEHTETDWNAYKNTCIRDMEHMFIVHHVNYTVGIEWKAAFSFFLFCLARKNLSQLKAYYNKHP